MQYIIIPIEKYEQADKQIAEKLGLSNPRKSVDGTEVIMHIENYARLFGAASKARSKANYPIYDSEDAAFAELMQSEAWSTEE